MKAPFSDSIFEPDDEEFMDEFEYEEFQKKKEMALLMFQDMLSKEIDISLGGDIFRVSFSDDDKRGKLS